MISSLRPPDTYFQLERHDVAALVPLHCQSILEVGSGYGALGRALMARQPCAIDGIEINETARPQLDGIYRRYWIGDIEQIELEGCGSDYDCLLFPDVLEHLKDPWTVLRRLVSRLRPGGVVVASIPNVRNLALLSKLIIQGRWEYESSGLLDHGHLRFFTRRSIEKLFAENGLPIEFWQLNRDRYRGVRHLIACAARVLVPDIDVCQFLVRARKPLSCQ